VVEATGAVVEATGAVVEATGAVVEAMGRDVGWATHACTARMLRRQGAGSGPRLLRLNAVRAAGCMI